MSVSTGQRAKTEGRRGTRSAPYKRSWTDGLLLFVAVVGGLHVLVMLGLEAHRTLESRREIARLEGDIAELDREISELRGVTAHRTDAAYREGLARSQGFVYPDEILYRTVTE